jgi:hypothetical protein
MPNPPPTPTLLLDGTETNATFTMIVMILDPPRKGCDSVFLEQLISFRPKRVVYISCDPATQARDAKVRCSDMLTALHNNLLTRLPPLVTLYSQCATNPNPTSTPNALLLIPGNCGSWLQN